MAFRLARVVALAVIFAALAIPASASAADSSGGAAAPVETGPGYDPNAPSGGAVVGAITPPPPAPKSTDQKSGGKRKKKKTSSTSSKPRFPIAGAHDYGSSGARFGAPRSGHSHQGQDVMAGEGTPLVAPMRGYIKYVAYQAGGAGNYIVMHAYGTKYDFVFMHLQSGSVRVHEGQRVSAGKRIGKVGHTGAASGPHLHFEVWVGSWQAGGHPIDPLPLLKRWDR